MSQPIPEYARHDLAAVLDIAGSEEDYRGSDLARTSSRSTEFNALAVEVACRMAGSEAVECRAHPG